MMLYFKKLGASATVLGVLACLAALLNIFQIPAARFVEKIGYRSFVLRGWASRSVMIGAIALVAGLPLPMDVSSRQIFVIFLLFLFNTARGISLSGYLPWISAIVPETVRGRFLTIDQAASQTALLLTVSLTGWFLGHTNSPQSFGLLFAASMVLAGFSLIFLRRIPDTPTSKYTSEEGVPWRTMLGHPPFLRLLIFVTAHFFERCAHALRVVLIQIFLRRLFCDGVRQFVSHEYHGDACFISALLWRDKFTIGNARKTT